MEHPAERYVRSMRALRTRATLATVSLALAAGVDLYDLVGRVWSIQVLRAFQALDSVGQANAVGQLEHADSLIEIGGTAAGLTLTLTAILFLRWVHRLVTLARGLGATYLSWSPAQAVWSFFLPFVNLIRPYQVLAEVEERINPADIDEPSPRVDRDAVTDYRGTKFTAAPPPKHVPRALIGLWWGTWMAAKVLTNVAMTGVKHSDGVDSVVNTYYFVIFTDILSVIAAVLAIHVVRALTDRLEERFRRIRHTEPDLLERQVALG